MAAKGLANQPGENNCFLNCAVQALWHVDVFRESLKVISGHRCTGAACIFCALKVTFTQLSYSEQQTLTPDALRRALAHSFCAEQRFQLGDMDDAAECLDTLLQRLHLHLCESSSNASCEAGHCIPHAKFGMRIREQSVCPRCGPISCSGPQGGGSASGEQYTQLIHYVAADALVTRVRQLGASYSLEDFSGLLQAAASAGDVRPCPNACGQEARLSRALLAPSSVLILGLVWNSQQPSVSFLADAVESIGTSLQPEALFEPQHSARAPAMRLTAMVCYYGRHYSAFCRQPSGAWTFFDDDVVRDIGSSWRGVVHRCVRGGYQPLLLLYTNPAGQAVAAGTAMPNTLRVPMEQLRRETVPAESSGSLGRLRVSPGVSSPAPGPPGDAPAPSGLSAHSRSSSQSEETLLAGGNPHLHRRAGPRSPPLTPPLSPPPPPPPPQFANETPKTLPAGQEFRRQGSYISAVLDRPDRLVAAPSGALDVTPPTSPRPSPVRRANSSCSPQAPRSSGAESADSPLPGRYIERQTVQAVLKLQQQHHGAGRKLQTDKPAARFDSLPRRHPQHLQHLKPQDMQQYSQHPQHSQHPQQLQAHVVQHPQQLQAHVVQHMQHHPQPQGKHLQHTHGMQPPQALQHPIRPPLTPGAQRRAAQSAPLLAERIQQLNALPSPAHVMLQAQRSCPQKAVQQAGVVRQHPIHVMPQPQLQGMQQVVQHKIVSHRALPAQPVEAQRFPQQPPKSVPYRPSFGQKPPSDQMPQPAVQQQHVVQRKPRSSQEQQQHLLQQQNLLQQQHAATSVQKATSISGACPKCGIADSWTVEAGFCVRCKIKIAQPVPPPLKSALSSRTSISSSDSSGQPFASPSSPRPKKSVTFCEPERGRPRLGDTGGPESCQLCQQRPVVAGGAYCSCCQVYLAQFTGQAR